MHIGQGSSPMRSWRKIAKPMSAAQAMKIARKTWRGVGRIGENGGTCEPRFSHMATEVAVLSGGAMKSGLAEAIAAWEKRTGHKVKATYAPAGAARLRAWRSASR